MIHHRGSMVTLFLILLLSWGCDKKVRTDYDVKPVPFTDVRLLDDFWAPRMEVNRTVTIPFAMAQNEETGRIDNFRISSGNKRGAYQGERYNDTDVYKVLEGMAYTLALFPDPQLEKILDDTIAVIAHAQEEDGYLFTPRTAGGDNPPIGIGSDRWSNLAVSHELYNAGHLFEAAAAHYSATGKRTFLDVALKFADLLVDTFGPEKMRAFPGHQEVELGLVKLYRITGDKAYLNLAKFFLDVRGPEIKLKQYPPGHRFAIYNDLPQIQAHKPVLKQEEAVGHAVRVTYMAAGMADVAALMGSEEYIEAVTRLWSNVVRKKMALTGGLGAHHDRERFGENYELPNLESYNETCASIGSVFWNHRLFLLHKDARYIDVLERTLYNGIIVGVSLEGDTFFYPNPLESDGKFLFNKGSGGRQPWFGTACCPGNISRFLPSLPGYVYAVEDEGIYVNLFVESEAEMSVGSSKVELIQKTKYPWEGKIEIMITPEHEENWMLHIRIPGWAMNRPVPGDLYRYTGESNQRPVIKVNGQNIDPEIEKGFAKIDRTWKMGDTVTLELPMPVRQVISHPLVKDNEGKIALERGPLVYCLEGVDHDEHVLDLVLPEDGEYVAEFVSGFLKGLTVLHGKAVRKDTGREIDLTAIPYFAWSHRGFGEMAVWIPKTNRKSIPQ